MVDPFEIMKESLEHAIQAVKENEHMNTAENQVRDLVAVELASANAKFPQFHSPHEGWSVMQEKIKELVRECKRMKRESKDMFDCIMENETVSGFARDIKRHAIYAACEAIQVATMAQKYLCMEGKE